MVAVSKSYKISLLSAMHFSLCISAENLILYKYNSFCQIFFFSLIDYFTLFDDWEKNLYSNFIFIDYFLWFLLQMAISLMMLYFMVMTKTKVGIIISSVYEYSTVVSPFAG